MGTILYLVWLVLVIMTIIDVLKSGIDSTKKLLWILLIIIVPILGLILWYLIGRRG